MTQHLLVYFIMGDARNGTASVDEMFQWTGLVHLRLVYDGRLMCDLMDWDRRVDVLSIYSCVYKGKVC